MGSAPPPHLISCGPLKPGGPETECPSNPPLSIALRDSWEIRFSQQTDSSLLAPLIRVTCWACRTVQAPCSAPSGFLSLRGGARSGRRPWEGRFRGWPRSSGSLRRRPAPSLQCHCPPRRLVGWWRGPDGLGGPLPPQGLWEGWRCSAAASGCHWRYKMEGERVKLCLRNHS